KSRGQLESKRRQLIKYLLMEAAKKNNDIRVLAMSATPVINSLDEAVSLLEMVTGREYRDLDTRPKVSSALAVHEQLVIHGVPYLPRYEMELHERPVEITRADLAERLQSVGKGAPPFALSLCTAGGSRQSGLLLSFTNIPVEAAEREVQRLHRSLRFR